MFYAFVYCIWYNEYEFVFPRTLLYSSLFTENGRYLRIIELYQNKKTCLTMQLSSLYTMHDMRLSNILQQYDYTFSYGLKLFTI